MKRDEAIKLAKKAGGRFDGSDWKLVCEFDDDDLLAFANLVAESVVPEGYVLVPRQAIEDAIESLGNFTSDLGWGDGDMQAMDNLIAVLAAAPSKETT